MCNTFYLLWRHFEILMVDSESATSCSSVHQTSSSDNRYNDAAVVEAPLPHTHTYTNAHIYTYFYFKIYRLQFFFVLSFLPFFFPFLLCVLPLLLLLLMLHSASATCEPTLVLTSTFYMRTRYNTLNNNSFK